MSCCLGVYVHRRLDVSMTHDCLNHFQIGFVFAKPGTKCVPQMMAREIRKNNRLSPFSFGLYDFLGIVAMSDSLDRAVNGLRIRHAAISVDKYESGHSINNRLVETVVLLSKGEIDSKKVRVEFSLEDMDMSGFQKGATYEQIKAYVLEHTGLKVSSLYISQIKRKCGLDVGQNYNLSKKEDAKVPKCPPEKEAAIRDALKYFQMI